MLFYQIFFRTVPIFLGIIATKTKELWNRIIAKNKSIIISPLPRSHVRLQVGGMFQIHGSTMNHISPLLFTHLIYGVISVSKLPRLLVHYEVGLLYYEVGPVYYEVSQVHYEVAPVYYEVGLVHYEIGPVHCDVGAVYYEVGPVYYEVGLMPPKVLDRPHKKLDRPHNELDRPHNKLDRPHNQLDRPHNQLDRPHNELSNFDTDMTHTWRHIGVKITSNE